MSISFCSSSHKPTTSENLALKDKSKKMNYFFQKIASKQQPEQALVSFSILFRQQQPLTTLVIINSRAKDHFFTNKNLITNYKKHLHGLRLAQGK